MQSIEPHADDAVEAAAPETAVFALNWNIRRLELGAPLDNETQAEVSEALSRLARG